MDYFAGTDTGQWGCVMREEFTNESLAHQTSIGSMIKRLCGVALGFKSPGDSPEMFLD